MVTETWLPLPGFEDSYEVSDLGRVRSRDRVLRWEGGHRLAPGRILKPAPNRQRGGHLNVVLGRGRTRMVHHLVLETFVGPPPLGGVTRHLNDDPADNRLVNLAWGTYSENMHDRVRNGIHPGKNKTRCKRGHERTPENTLYRRRQRVCRLCNVEYQRRYRESRIGVK